MQQPTTVSKAQFQVEKSTKAVSEGMIPFVSVSADGTLKISAHQMTEKSLQAYLMSKDAAKQQVVFIVNQPVTLATGQQTMISISGTQQAIAMALRSATAPQIPEQEVVRLINGAITAANFRGPAQRQQLSNAVSAAASIIQNKKNVKDAKAATGRAGYVEDLATFQKVAEVYASHALKKENITYVSADGKSRVGGTGSSKGSRGATVEDKYLAEDFKTSGKLLNISKMRADGRGATKVDPPKGGGNKTSRFIGSGGALRIVVDKNLANAYDLYAAAAGRIAARTGQNYSADLANVRAKLGAANVVVPGVAPVVPGASVASPRPLPTFGVPMGAPTGLPGLPGFRG